VISFTKMHGIGNDYVYIYEQQAAIPDPGQLAKRISDRHFGVGSDGLVLILPSEQADFMMDMYNSDGSRGRMCGNAIRCVGRYVYERGLTKKKILQIETLSGIRTLHLNVQEGQVESVAVDMGRPILKPADIPVRWNDAQVVDEPIAIDGQLHRLTCLSMGNPHAVVFMTEIDHLNLPRIGPLFENHSLFPDRINTEFVQVIDRKTLRMRVWERGAGETMACGTGACAALVAAVLTGRTEREATVKLLGGDLSIRYDAATDIVWMTGPATFVFDGTLDPTWL
jgi:diaminopimelate epimerase